MAEYDDTLQLTDDGIEMPEMLRGYTGEFTQRTADVTATLTTTDSGLPDVDVYDGIIAVYPSDDGDHNSHLREGLMSFETPEHEEVVYRVIDDRTAPDAEVAEVETDA